MSQLRTFRLSNFETICQKVINWHIQPPAFTCSKPTAETLEKNVKHVECRG